MEYEINRLRSFYSTSIVCQAIKKFYSPQNSILFEHNPSFAFCHCSTYYRPYGINYSHTFNGTL